MAAFSNMHQDCTRRFLSSTSLEAVTHGELHAKELVPLDVSGYIWFILISGIICH